MNNNLIERALNINIDKAICISLKNEIERRNKTKIECQKIGLPVEFFIVEKNPLDGIMGCLESHIKVIQYAKQNNFNNILILEDDVYFDKEAINNISINLPDDWEMFYLGYHINNGYRYNNNILKLLSSLTTHAYIIKNTLYDYILENINLDWSSIPEFHKLNEYETPFFQLNNKAIDIFYSKWVNHRLNTSYGIYPIFAYQRPEYSHIENRYVDYTNLFKNKSNIFAQKYLGQYRGFYSISSSPKDFNHFEQLAEHLKSYNYSEWDYILISDERNLLHERKEKYSINIMSNMICDYNSWDILSLTETCDEPNPLKLLNMTEFETFRTKYANVFNEIMQNKKKLYTFLDNQNDFSNLKEQISKQHIYYLRMSYFKNKLYPKIYYKYPPIDKYVYSQYNKNVVSDKQFLCIYLPDNLNFSDIEDKLGNIDNYYVFVCNNSEDSEKYINITKRQMVNLPKHKLILVNDIMYFADQPNHTTDITLFMTQPNFFSKWKSLTVPFEGRSMFHNFINDINNIYFLDHKTKQQFFEFYNIYNNKNLCYILDKHPHSNKHNNSFACYNSKHIDDIIKLFHEIKIYVPNAQLYIYNSNKYINKKFKHNKNIHTINSKHTQWKEEFLLEYDNQNLSEDANTHGTICIGKKYSHFLIDDNPNTIKSIISFIMNPVKKHQLRQNILNNIFSSQSTSTIL